MSFAACWITLLLLSIGSHAKSLKIGFRRRFTDGSDAIRTDSLESRKRQRDLLDEFGATTISEIQKSPIVMEDLAALIVTMDSGMSYMMDPTKSPTQLPSKSPTTSQSPSFMPSVAPTGCTTSGARTRDIVSYVESISSASDLSNPLSAQSRAKEWLLNQDLNTNGCDGGTAISHRYGLAMFYYSTNGQSWKKSDNWLTPSSHECDWFGIVCAGNKTVEVINLPENDLIGQIPDEFFTTLPALKTFSVWANSLSGPFPLSIKTLTQFTILDIEQNNFSGSIFTSELFNLTGSLKKLRVSSNQFVDQIPDSIGEFSLLDDLWIANNAISGTLPTQLGTLQLLTELIVYNNPNLSGTIPTELGSLPVSFRWLDARNCDLTGPIPEELSNLTGLQRLILRGNSLTGSIPSGVSSLTLLEQLVLGENSLTSTLPQSFEDLKKMKVLDLKKNSFVGTIPDVAQWVDLARFDISNNTFSGSIPNGYFEDKPQLELLYFSNNTLTGQIPAGYYNPPKLIDLYLDGNRLTGTIPVPPPDAFPSIEEILFHRNDLSGSVPSELCAIRNDNLDTFINLFADCAPNPTDGVVQTPCACCTQCFI